MKYYAHTVQGKGENEWHVLSSHLRKTGEMAASFACNDVFAQFFKIAGYLHDLGKYQNDFQNYLKNGGRRGSVPHASFGAGYASILNNHEISFAIDGHHKGMPDSKNWKIDVAQHRKDGLDVLNDIVRNFLSDTGILEQELNIRLPEFKDKHERELFTRFIFSSLTDADWLDTEKNCNPELSGKREHSFLDYDKLIQKLEQAINEKQSEGELNQLRRRTREYALSRANMSPGFYSMNLPTGMGKTLSSISWGLKHAKENRLKRIIIVLPFVNIIDQTAGILKDIFGEENVLEHHSGVSDDIEFAESISDVQYSRRLACENWDFPVIVTTTVQFFESLFSNRPSKCRKIHNIADSVVIFDEVQTLPKEIIIPTLTMLKNVQSVMNTSFLFCTATLPAFEKRDRFDGIESIIPLVDNPDELFNKTRRVTYHAIKNYEPVDYNELVSAAENQNCSILAVFNTKRSAREFYNYAMGKDSWEKLYHLSTSMCPVHRKQVIKDIRNDLAGQRKIFVSSTQLIEAGVDFDFPCVMREIAPLESIIQSAGRCNRENKMEGYGNVYLFKLQDAEIPDKLYGTTAGFAKDMIMEEPDNLYKHDFYPVYYRKVINLFVNGDAKNINKARENFNFETVSNSYRIIDNVTKGLFIYNYSDSGKEMLDSIRIKQYLSRDDYRRMQIYTVQVYESFIVNNRDFIEITDNGIMVWYGGYDEKTGISVDPLESDKYVV